MGEWAVRSRQTSKARPASLSGDGCARRSDWRVDGERLLRRIEAALNGLPARDCCCW